MNKIYSTPNYKSVEQPFFVKDISNINNIIVDINLKDKLNTLDLSDEIKEWFITNKTSSQEIYFNNWTIMSIDSIIKRSNITKKDNIYVTDIAFQYSGLGWIIVAFYDPKLNKINFRYDGGSNNYDRLDNYNKLKKYKSDDVSKVLEFKEFLMVLEN